VNSITGYGNNVYVIYKKGSQIITKKTTNNGSSWSSPTAISMTYSTSDGIDAVSDNHSVYMAWSERYSSPNTYETNYMKLNHQSSKWTDLIQVTDEPGRYGGLPSVALAPSRVLVGFTALSSDGASGSIYSRELYNGSWQSSNYVYYGIQGLFSSDNSQMHSFVYDFGDTPLPYGEPDYMLSHLQTDIGSNYWNNYYTIMNYGEGNIPGEIERASLTKSNNNFTHIVYNG
jgi:hypothetical protein